MAIGDRRTWRESWAAWPKRDWNEIGYHADLQFDRSAGYRPSDPSSGTPYGSVAGLENRRRRRYWLLRHCLDHELRLAIAATTLVGNRHGLPRDRLHDHG